MFLVVQGRGSCGLTIVQGFRGRPFDRDLSEATLCSVDAVVLLTGHPKVTDLHQVILCNQTVSRCQVPFEQKKATRQGERWKRDVSRGWWKVDTEETHKHNVLYAKREPAREQTGIREQEFSRHVSGVTCEAVWHAALQAEQLPAACSHKLYTVMSRVSQPHVP